MPFDQLLFEFFKNELITKATLYFTIFFSLAVIPDGDNTSVAAMISELMRTSMLTLSSPQTCPLSDTMMSAHAIQSCSRPCRIGKSAYRRCAEVSGNDDDGNDG